MTSVETRPFEARDAALYVELGTRAFASVPRGQRQRDTAERVAHLHGAANPAGRAIVAVARLEGRAVGFASGLPARYLGRDGVARVGWQVGCFVVDPGVQRQGVGRELVDALTRVLAARTGEFVYTFPNPRSSPVFERRGYVRCASAPTRIVLARRRRSAGASGIRLGDGSTARALDADAARNTVSALSVPAPERGQFVRDAAWFAWRFLDPSVAPAYRFARIEHARHGELVVAIAAHAYRGLAFSVLADALPALTAATLPAAVQTAAAVGASRLVYLTTNLPAVGGGLTALGTRVPERFDPRPVHLLALPGGPVDARELGASAIQTADWMGF